MMKKRTKDNLKNEIESNPVAIFGVVLVLTMLLMATFAPIIAPHNPNTQHSEINHQPPVGFGSEEEETVRFVDGEMKTVTEDNLGQWTHMMGTDANGRDLTSRVIYGARTSILVALTAVTISVIVGTIVGLTAGYYGGRVDSGLMRFVDVILAFPAILVALTLFPILGPLSFNIPDPIVMAGLASDQPTHITFPVTITLAISAVTWVWIARIARSESIAVRNEDYITAAQVMGMSNAKIIRKHVLPNCITPILVLATVLIASVIITESSLSFLGFSGTTLSWGYDIAQGRDYLGSSWWIATAPGIFISLTVIGINLIGDWIRDALDPGVKHGDA